MILRKKFVAATTHSCSVASGSGIRTITAVEPETISNNGDSPKIHKSRSNFLTNRIKR